MTNKECRHARQEIDELELGHRPSMRTTVHLAACVGCREFQAERTSMRELVGSLEPVVAPPDFDMRLRARIAAEKYDNRRQPFFARLVSTPALAAAALFVIVAGSVFWISRRPSPPIALTSNPGIANNNPQPITPVVVNQPNSGEVSPTSGEGTDVAVNPIKTVHRPRGGRSSYSEDSLVRPADSVSQTDLDQAYVPNRPVEFALQNESGKTRRISLPPVSFGAQNLVSNNRTDVKYTQTSRVW